MADAMLEVHDSLGRRIVPLDKPAFTIGRRAGNDLHLMGSDVSRDHAEISQAEGRFVVRDRGTRFETSRKIPEEVFATGQEKIVADLLDGDLANVHMGTVALGIRHVLCTPLRLVRYVDRVDASSEEKRIGVVYLDSREKGTLLSRATRSALETLAVEAAVAIENARLYRDSVEKARIEQELRIASQIQQ